MMLYWNIAFSLAKNSLVAWNIQSECFVSAKHNYATLKFVYDFDSRLKLSTIFWCIKWSNNSDNKIIFDANYAKLV